MNLNRRLDRIERATDGERREEAERCDTCGFPDEAIAVVLDDDPIDGTCPTCGRSLTATGKPLAAVDTIIRIVTYKNEDDTR